MAHGVDRRDHTMQIQATAEELFADAVGADLTLLSTNGSSMSVHVALMTVAAPGDKILMARNGHKSAFAGLVLSGARPVWIDPVYDDELEIAHSVHPDALARALDDHPDARAAMVFTPTYYGTTADVAALAELCHGRGIPLVTDDAWGLDYSFGEHPELPPPALAQGADIAIGSVHKTLSGLCQTSVLSVQGDIVDTERLQMVWELEETTSVSALLLSSIDGARRQFVREGKELTRRTVETANRLRERLAAEVPELRVVTREELLAPDGVHLFDPTHPLIETAPLGITGYEAADHLGDNHSVYVEMMDHRRIMPLVTFAHGERELDRLIAGLRDLVDTKGGDASDLPEFDLPTREELRTDLAMAPREAYLGGYEMVDPQDAVGRVSAEMVTPYPPGIPAIAPGEVYTETVVDYLETVVGLGAFVEGAADQSLAQLRVVAH
jgi:arginine/lysine/ornithine decarboxylase